MALILTMRAKYRLSEQEGSPCLICLVGSVCTRSFKAKTMCQEYIIFALNKVKECIDEAENRLHNK
jgi:hypothetical protein